MDLAYVDKSAKDNIGVKFLLVRQYLIDGIVAAKGMQKDTRKKQSGHFRKRLPEKTDQRKSG